MRLSEKLVILIERKNISKTDFAEKIGITYRGLANYLNGTRKPKKDVLARIAEELETSVDFLVNDKKSLVLDSKERFIYHSKSDASSVREAAEYLEKGKALFSRSDLDFEDKQALFSCLTELYFNSTKENVG
ncbi:MAG: helix-turn-helix domain-containing protein [Bacteroides sp.]|nr:helix-turn-helix domain-containing protein [Eubacterium sp.]MCM1417310.1 helix-turn-helix domain-containing protein [Roseburia sp.]MCM1461070.1 helix-turn-helix domain-containing protein [Bacteroides sp.]